MHTDEYEISLLREVDVCRQYIFSLRASLQRMEKKYHLSSDTFVSGYGRAPYSADNRDFAAWFATYEALATWEKRKNEYEEIYRRMKI